MPTKKQGTRATQLPFSKKYEHVNVRAEFMATIADIAPKVVDDLFQRAFNVLSYHSNYQLEMFDLDKRLLRKIAAMHLRENQQRILDKLWLGKSIRDWADEYGLKVEWCYEFVFSTLRRYWGWQLQRASAALPSHPDPALIFYDLSFLAREHFFAWRCEVKQLKKIVEGSQGWLDLFDLDEINKQYKAGKCEFYLPASEPQPPSGIPSRIQGGTVISKLKWKELVRNSVSIQIGAQLEGLSFYQWASEPYILPEPSLSVIATAGDFIAFEEKHAAELKVKYPEEFAKVVQIEKRRRSYQILKQNCAEALLEGSVERLRPKFMTVAVDFIGLLPVMLAAGAGADLTKRIAAPMIAGMFFSFALELFVYPAIYAIWKWHTDVKKCSQMEAMETAAAG